MKNFPAGIWCCDFEFQREDDRELPVPVCMTALEINSGQTVRIFQEELRTLRAAPFPTGSDACVVAYSSGAEASNFAVLNWPWPENVIDPYGEHLRDLNGRPGRHVHDASLLSALTRHGLPAMSVTHKDIMRSMVRFQSSWNAEERDAILSYCMEDNESARDLLQAMDAKGQIDWERALWRGRYLFASGGHIEHQGIPIDVETYHRIQNGFPRLRHALIASNDTFGVFVDDHRNDARVANLIARTRLPWPRTETGKLRMDDETWKAMASACPALEPLRRLMVLLDQLRHTKLAIGSDGRNRF